MKARIKNLPTALSVAALAGAIVGGLMAVVHTAVNHYVQYGMYRLVSLDALERVSLNITYFVAGALLLYLVCLLPPVRAGGKPDRMYRFVIMVSAAAVAVYALDWVLRETTAYSVGRMVRIVIEGVKELRPSSITASSLSDFLSTRSVPILVLGLGAVAAVAFYLVIRRLPLTNMVERLLGQGSRIRRAAAVVIVVCLVLNLSAHLATRTAAPDSPNVMVIVIDCLRPDHLGCHGYRRDTSPNIDRLGESGLVADNAFTNAPWTKPSIATIFTSLYPNVHSTVSSTSMLSQRALTMAEILKNEGYRTLFLNGGNPFIGRRFRFEQGFDIVMDAPGGTEAAVLVNAFRSEIPDLRDRSFFAYFHFMDAHLPYSENRYNSAFADSMPGEHLRPGKIKVKEIREMTAAAELSQAEKEYLVDLYDGQITLVDEALKQITTSLEQEGLLENTLIVITADHGEEFWEHGNFEHGHTLYNEVLRVPLIMSGRGLDRWRLEANTGLIDLLPTILELTGIQCPGLQAEGRSLIRFREAEGTDRQGPIFATGTLYGSEKSCLIHENLKLIVNGESDPGKFELIGYRSQDETELYDLPSDPGEQTNLESAAGDVVIELRAELERFSAGEARFRAGSTDIDKSLRERLKSVGYL